MATFQYTISKEGGKTDSGSIRATNKDEASKLLRDQGLLVLSLTQLNEQKKGGSRKKVKLIEKVLFFDHLAQMIKAGLSLTDTLDALKDDTENKYFQAVIEDIKYGIETGNTFASGLEKYPKIFPHLFTKMIEVGEISGTLEESSKQIAVQAKKDYELRSKVKGALIYPEILSGIMIVAGVGLLVFVIPQLSTFFKQAGLKLPITTQILVGLSSLIKDNLIELAVLAVAWYFGFGRLMEIPKVKEMYDSMILKLPIVGAISHKLNMAIFARTLGSLLKSGVAIGKSLEIVADSSPNAVYKAAIASFKDSVEKGEPLSSVMQKYPKLFTKISTRMVAVGDKTGTTPDMLFNLADFYQTQVDETLANISTVIEPVMLFVMGGAVLFIALSVITPIYQLTSGISGAA